MFPSSAHDNTRQARMKFSTMSMRRVSRRQRPSIATANSAVSRQIHKPMKPGRRNCWNSGEYAAQERSNRATNIWASAQSGAA